MRAKIVRSVELIASKGGVSVDDVAALPERIPLMELESGEVVGAYNCHRYVALGTEGEAVYVPAQRFWAFTPDEDE